MTADFGDDRVDLAKETDFRLGGLLVHPSTRQIEVGGSSETLEPRVMQVLVVLARRAGQVVSRDDLIRTCWEGRIVGDDALNRCISKIRKLGETHQAFRLETIPRVGYRLRETGASAKPEAALAEPVPESASAPPPARLSHRTLAFIAAGVAVIVLVFAGWMTLGRNDKRIALEPSIAVLPFANLTGDAGKDYIARGVAVEIIEQLSRLEGLKVISRNSSFTFGADADPRKVGQDLKVANVLSGTVGQEGGRIVVSADLADTTSGAVVRSFSNDLNAGDPGAVQRLIAERIAGAMSIAFDVDKRARPSGSGTQSLEAYDFYLRGLDQWWYKGDRVMASDLFTQAVELDPNYAEAWAGRAIATASKWGSAPPAEAKQQFDEAYEMALRAVELDPNLSFAQTVLGAISSARKKWRDAEAATLQALKISRSEMALNNRQMLLLRTGQLNAAYAMMLELAYVDPLRDPDDLALGSILSGLGRHDDLREILSRRDWAEAGNADIWDSFMVVTARINAGDPPASVRQGLEALARSQERAPAEFASALLKVFDNPEKARAMLRSWYEDPDFNHPAKWDLIPILAAWYDDTDLVLRIWQNELPITTARTIYIWGPAFSKARSRPEFKTLAKEIGLVDYWRAYGWADKCQPVGEDDFDCV